MGSLVQDAQGASGLMYRRNRYYDPQTGKFTQEDPIGLAGGIDAYGFANGDPVSYSDPYGLRGDTIPSISENLVKLRARVKEYLILQGKKQLERMTHGQSTKVIEGANRATQARDDFTRVKLNADTDPDQLEAAYRRQQQAVAKTGDASFRSGVYVYQDMIDRVTGSFTDMLKAYYTWKATVSP